MACTDPDAPRPVHDLDAPPAGEAPLRPLTSQDQPARDTRPVAQRPLPPDQPDPTEAGISDLARLARYVFLEMRLSEDTCSFVNPLHETIAFAFHIEVAGGRMEKVHLAWAGVRAGDELRPLEAAPPELESYVECLAPRLMALPMKPAPADGTYEPEYSYPGHSPPPGS